MILVGLLAVFYTITIFIQMSYLVKNRPLLKYKAFPRTTNKKVMEFCEYSFYFCFSSIISILFCVLMIMLFSQFGR